MEKWSHRIERKLQEVIIASWKRLTGDYSDSEDWQPEYLRENSFDKELNFKLWITKDARFQASERCAELNHNSTKIVGWLSAYVVIISVLQLLDLPSLQFSNGFNTFITIAVSILVLVYSQMEYSMNYAVKSKEYHQCGLEISRLYDKLRKLKSDNQGKTPEEATQVMSKQLEEISLDYENILMKYDNHLLIDYEYAQSRKYKYFKLSLRKVLWIETKYFFKVKFQYYLWVWGTPIIYIALKFLCKDL